MNFVYTCKQVQQTWMLWPKTAMPELSGWQMRLVAVNAQADLIVLCLVFPSPLAVGLLERVYTSFLEALTLKSSLV